MDKQTMYREIVKRWDSENTEQIATALNVKKSKVQAMAGSLRKRGVNLARRSNVASVLTTEFLAELKGMYSR